MAILVEERSVVVPGEELAEGMDHLPGFGTYRKDDKILASRLGIVNVDGRALKIIPVSGAYCPKTNDVIIGSIIDITMSGWRVDTGSAYSAMLMLKTGARRLTINSRLFAMSWMRRNGWLRNAIFRNGLTETKRTIPKRPINRDTTHDSNT